MKRILQIPPRISALFASNHGRVFKVILLTLVFITALYTKEYRGEHQQIINNNIGGIFYVLLCSLTLSALMPKLRYYWAVLTAFGVTCMLEFIQYLQLAPLQKLEDYKIFAYLFGVNFNPKDFIYYFVGAIISILLLFILHREDWSK